MNKLKIAKNREFYCLKSLAKSIYNIFKAEVRPKDPNSILSFENATKEVESKVKYKFVNIDISITMLMWQEQHTPNPLTLIISLIMHFSSRFTDQDTYREKKA